MACPSKLFRNPPREKPKRETWVTTDKPDTYFKQREAWLTGTSGPASPCKRICPQTGRVLEIIERKDDPAPSAPDVLLGARS